MCRNTTRKFFVSQRYLIVVHYEIQTKFITINKLVCDFWGGPGSLRARKIPLTELWKSCITNLNAVDPVKVELAKVGTGWEN